MTSSSLVHKSLYFLIAIIGFFFISPLLQPVLGQGLVDAVDDSYTLVDDQNWYFPAPGLLENDTPGLSISISDPITTAGGTVQVSSDGSWYLAYSGGYVGNASFTYTIDDGTGTQDTATYTMTPSPTPTDTATYTPTATDTATSTATYTATYTPTATDTATYTPTATDTATYTPTATDTATYTPTATDTATHTATPTDTATYTMTPSPTATDTATSTATYTPTATSTPALMNRAPRLTIYLAKVSVIRGQVAVNIGDYSDLDRDSVRLIASLGTISKTGSSSGFWLWTYTVPSTTPRGAVITVNITATDTLGIATTQSFRVRVR